MKSPICLKSTECGLHFMEELCVEARLGHASWFGCYLHKDDILVIGLMMYRPFAGRNWIDKKDESRV